ncbi:glycosyltransferase family 87 protein [Corynebacterium endometrii]|uniref:Alpha-(1->3)-arabinofuranosyltransferase n=1 Tax=Corynebacterium endometrii TaxID=2488819 RepID=A0A4P7QH31_9CORY|nr:glycosyltransferase family 87 protein [Corynebacterium endometrii]QCB28296.1 Alpha-(1->3)-arabinofuranosyltransferase [Corynebacterium endometrii]
MQTNERFNKFYPLLGSTIASQPVWKKTAMKALWLAAVVGLFHVLVWSTWGTHGPDFDPIWNAVDKYVNGEPIYTADYSTQDPHYLYSPGATFLISPIGLLPGRDIARWIMLYLGAACIFFAMWLLAKSLTRNYTIPVFLGFIALTCFSNEPVKSTLAITNINGFLFMLQVIFALSCVEAIKQRQQLNDDKKKFWAWNLGSFGNKHVIIAGIALGFAMAIKPQFVAMAVVPFFAGQWSLLVIAAVFIIVTFAIGWFTMAQPMDYVERLLPYLSQARDYNNGSIDGMAIQMGWPDGLRIALTIVFLASVAFAVWALWRWKDSAPMLWMYASLGVLFCGVLMSSGLMQGYYCIWLFPMFATFVLKQSPMHSVFMWVAAWCLMASGSGLPEGIWEPLAQVFRWRSSIAWLVIPLFVGIWALAKKPSAHVDSPAVVSENSSRVN